MEYKKGGEGRGAVSVMNESQTALDLEEREADPRTFTRWLMSYLNTATDSDLLRFEIKVGDTTAPIQNPS